jgi:hydroxymethylbilane synthase
MSERVIRVATRKSPLAMRQTELAVAALQEACPHWRFEVLPMSTTGDERLAWSLETSGGKGLFTSALEAAIVAGEADLAVHSAKDLPTQMPAGVALAGYLPRAPAHDVLVRREGVEPGLIATSSPRRRAQLKGRFPGAAWKEIRGNIQTRLEKLVEGHADASVMAKAGFFRMGIDAFPGLTFEDLPIEVSVPAAGQGAIGLQVREEDAVHFRPHLCVETGRAVSLERAFLAAMGGGCHSASAAHYAAGRLYCFDEAFGYRCHVVPDTLWDGGDTALREWAEQQLS